MFKEPSYMPHTACVPRGSTGRPSTRHSRDESRAAQSDTIAQTAQHVTGNRNTCKCWSADSGFTAKNRTTHGTNTRSAAIARIAVAAARTSRGVSFVKSMFGEPAGASKPAYFSGCSGLRVRGLRRLTDESSAPLLRSISCPAASLKSDSCRDKGRIAISVQI